MRVLVTGGGGFIGANLARQLRDRGASVAVFDRFTTAPPAYLEGVEVSRVTGDIRDANAVAAAMAGSDAVVHLAAQSGIVPSLRDPRSDFEINVGGTLNVLEAARTTGVHKVVFASSNAALGRQTPPATEEKAPLPVSPYGAAKLAGEAYCLAYHAAFGVRATALRFGNVYGPFSAHKTSVVARFFDSVLRREPITVEGDGLQTRDFIHVADLCRAIVRCLETETGGEVFQIASGHEKSIAAVAAMIREVVGDRLDIASAPARSVDVRRVVATVTKARDLLAWQPEIEMQDGLASTWEWFRSWTAREDT